MEETVRAMLAYKKQAEQLRQEKAALTLAFEVRFSSFNCYLVIIHQYMHTPYNACFLRNELISHRITFDKKYIFISKINT